MSAKTIDASHLRRRSLVTLILIYAQMILGAQIRHFGTSLLIHAVMAAAVWGHAALLVWRVERNRHDLRPLVPSARAMGVFVTLQIALGVFAWLMLRPFDGIPREVSAVQALVRVGHQGIGALLLASAVILTMRAYLRLASPQVDVSRQSVARTLEAVA